MSLNLQEFLNEVKMKRKRILCRQEEEYLRVETHFQSILSQIEDARTIFVKQLDNEATGFHQQLDEVEKNLNDFLNEVGDPEMIIDAEIFGNNNHKDINRPFPTFCSLECENNLKSHKLGFFQLTEYLPRDFFLSLDTESPCIKNNIVCSVKINGEFSDDVQENLEFSVTVKDKAELDHLGVQIQRGLCCVSEDKKCFKICFQVENSGNYVVKAKVYGQHVTCSPMYIEIPSNANGNDVTKVDKVRSMVLNLNNARDKTIDTSSKADQVPPSQPNKLNSNILRRPRAPNALKSKDNNMGKQEMPNNLSSSVRHNVCESTNEFCSDLSLYRGQLQHSSVNDKQNSPSEKPVKNASAPAIPTKGEEGEENGVHHNTSPESQAVSELQNVFDFKKLIMEDCLDNDALLIPLASRNKKGGKLSLALPIGMCILKNSNIAVASTFQDQVKIFDSNGRFLKSIRPGIPFEHPSDMITLRSGHFAVRDNSSIQIFSEEGVFLKSIDSMYINKCFGLAEDKSGFLVTINENKAKKQWGKKNHVENSKFGTAQGDADLLFFNIETGKLKRKVALDLIQDKQRSKCRFLALSNNKAYITDLGLDCIYILNLESEGGRCKNTTYGGTGTGPGCFSDPAGLAVDSLGNMLVADSRNHRVCVYSKDGVWVGDVKLSPEARRPSGLVFDEKNKHLYLLNLQGEHALVRWSLKR